MVSFFLILEEKAIFFHVKSGKGQSEKIAQSLRIWTGKTEREWDTVEY